MTPRSKTFIRYKLYQVPLFLSWLMSLTHCAANAASPVASSAALSTGAEANLAATGAYQLINVKSHLALDLQNSGTQNGNPVVTSQPSNAASQQWALRAETNGGYAIINAQSQQALDLYEGLSTPGTPIQAWADQQGTSQRWQLTAQGNDVYQIISVASGECLDLTSGGTSAGTRAQQWTCQEQSDEMLWQMVASAPSTQPSTTGSTGATNGGAYTAAQLTADMNNVLQNRSPIYSNRNLGNPANIAMWTPEKIQSLLSGIITAQDVFYANISLTDLAHLIISEGAQESTGNYNLPGWSEGFIQSTPSTVGQDFTNHGKAVTSSVGTLITPTQAIDYDDPGQNVVSWAWYTYNVVAAGESMNEVAMGNPQGQVTRDFGNAEFDWLAGPHNDRHNAAQAAAYKDYHDRIKDYFVQSNFGTADQFENLLDTPTGSALIDEH